MTDTTPTADTAAPELTTSDLARTEGRPTTQVHRVYIKATAEAIWDAITQPEWTAKYGYTGYVDFDLRPGGHYLVRTSEGFRAASEAAGHRIPDINLEGEVIEVEPAPAGSCTPATRSWTRRSRPSRSLG